MTADNQPDQRPTPDPTVLTTEQLLREVARAEELMEVRTKGVEDMCEQRFSTVKEQFQIVERQRVEQKEDTKAAVDAAFSAAKEAVKEQTNASEKAISKSEGSTKEQLAQLTTTFTTAIGSVSQSLDDLKERVGKIESVKQGGKEAYAGLNAVAGFCAVVLGIIVILAAAGVFG